jgi:signal transduction histidine kinase
MGRRTILLSVAGAGVAVGIFSLHVARLEPAISFAGASAIGAAALLGAGWALIGCGLAYASWRRTSSFGPLLALSGFAWFLVEWNNELIGSSLAFTVGLCLYASCAPLLAHAVLAYPTRARLRPLEGVALAALYAGSVVLVGVVPALLYDPHADACGDCPRNLVFVADRPGAAEQLSRIGLYVTAVAAVVVAGVLLRRLVRATAAARLVVWPVAAAGAVYLVLAAAMFAASVDRGVLWNGELERRLWIGQAAALAVLVLGVAAAAARARRARAKVARVVVELGRSPSPGGLRDLLAGIVGDPQLVLAYPLDGTGRLVDVSGRPVDLSGCEHRTTFVHDGHVAAVAGHARRLADAQVVDEIATAALLALENERLQAEVRARLAELRASRARVVEAGDAARKRLERDLHDGTQQRLVALSLSLRLLRSKQPGTEELDAAEAELDRAIAELRDLAHGIFPAVLAEGGLAVAVRALGEEAHVPMRVGELPEGRFPVAVETAVYTVVAEAAKAATGTVSVRGDCLDGVLAVEVGLRATELPNAAAIEDRVGALDGRIDVEHGEDGSLTVRAELPCAS